MNYCFPGPNFNLISISIKINTTLPDTLALRHRHSVFHEPRGNVAPRHPGCSHILKLFFFGFFSSSIQDFFAHGDGTHRPDLPTALNGTTFSVEVTVTATEAVMDWHQNPALPHHVLQRYQYNSDKEDKVNHILPQYQSNSEEDKVKLTSHNWPSWSKAASPSSVLFAKFSSSCSDGGSCISTESSAKEQEHHSKRRQEAILNSFILVFTYLRVFSHPSQGLLPGVYCLCNSLGCEHSLRKSYSCRPEMRNSPIHPFYFQARRAHDPNG